MAHPAGGRFPDGSGLLTRRDRPGHTPAALFGLVSRARFVVGDLTATGLPPASTDAVVSIDALHFAAGPADAAHEARRILRPGGRLALTNWQPKVPGDTRPPERGRIDWPQVLRSAGLTRIEVRAAAAIATGQNRPPSPLG